MKNRSGCDDEYMMKGNRKFVFFKKNFISKKFVGLWEEKQTPTGCMTDDAITSYF